MKKAVMNKWIKSIALVFLLILILSMFSVVQSDGDNFDTGAFDNYDGDTKVNELVDNTAETAVAVLRVASVAIAIVVLLVIAMKYMISSSCFFNSRYVLYNLLKLKPPIKILEK